MKLIFKVMLMVLLLLQLSVMCMGVSLKLGYLRYQGYLHYQLFSNGIDWSKKIGVCVYKVMLILLLLLKLSVMCMGVSLKLGYLR